MTPAPDRPRFREFLRRHDRGLALGYLLLVILLLGAFAAPPTRIRLLDAVQAGIRRWDDRWTARVERGEALVREHRYAEAASYLERLDREFPARNVRHARDKERERVLVALGRAYGELGKKTRAMDAYHRLAEFDPRNYRNLYALGLASNRLLAGWAPAPEARDAFLQVLQINPNHLPSVRGAIAFYSARAEFSQVVQLYQDYLDAYLVQRVTVRLGDAADTLFAPVDGSFHEYELALSRPRHWAGPLSVETGGFSFGLEEAVLIAPLRVGEARTPPETELPVDHPEAVSLVRLPDGSWRADAGAARLVLQATAPDGIALVRLRLRLFKPVDPTTWSMVEPAYRNLLDDGGLARAQARTVVLPSVTAADSVLLRPEWATEGLGVGADDSRYLQ